MEVVCPPKLTVRKRYVFRIEKYIEDAKQDEKHVPDLLEAIIQPPGLVREEVRPIFFKMTRFIPEITKIEPILQKSGFGPKVKSSKMGLSITPRGWGSGPHPFRNIWPR